MLRTKIFRVRLFVESEEFPFTMSYRMFVNLTHIPRRLIPPWYRKVSWRQIGRLLRANISSFCDFAHFVEEYAARRCCRFYGDNTYNYGWWGPTVNYKVVEFYSPCNVVIAVVGMHLGGDVRSGYVYYPFVVTDHDPHLFGEGVDLYTATDPFRDIFGSLRLYAEVVDCRSGEKRYAEAVDTEAVEWLWCDSGLPLTDVEKMLIEAAFMK